ncbi:MAG: energy-coupling factor transporter transmembrane protein EcfT [Deltaproteobacteria bacterium]|nr:energy-coupling factor transporter transmembrane protein EcfT [Deltaproteobacteria bacterium]
MYHTGLFINGNSTIHRLDPRVKLAAAVILSVMILGVKAPTVILLGLALLGAVLAGRISFRIIGQAVKPLLFFAGLIFFTHAFFSEGEALALITLPYLKISVSRTGIAEGGLVVFRFLCLTVAAVVLTMTTTPARTIAAIKFFLRPLKTLRVPVDDIAVMMMVAMRLMPVLLMEKDRIETAQKARGYDLRGSTTAVRLKAFISLIKTVLLGVFRRADELAAAMEARSYNRGERTTFIELKMRSIDYITLAILFITGGIMTGLNTHF